VNVAGPVTFLDDETFKKDLVAFAARVNEYMAPPRPVFEQLKDLCVSNLADLQRKRDAEKNLLVCFQRKHAQKHAEALAGILRATDLGSLTCAFEHADLELEEKGECRSAVLRLVRGEGFAAVHRDVENRIADHLQKQQASGGGGTMLSRDRTRGQFCAHHGSGSVSGLKAEVEELQNLRVVLGRIKRFGLRD
jgi:hypothetical protein